LFNCHVEAGTAGYWSEIATLNTLNSLLQSGNISMAQYLERIPDKLIPKKEELLEEINSSAGITETEEGEV